MLKKIRFYKLQQQMGNKLCVYQKEMINYGTYMLYIYVLS